MQVKSITTHLVKYGDSLEQLLDQYIPTLEDESVLAITSKVISVLEGRFVSKDNCDKYQLIRQEADMLLKTDHNPYNVYLTIKNGILIPSAGIDESNADNVYILYPSDTWYWAEHIWQYLRNKHGIIKLGVLITDSHTTIMRAGVTGIALGWCGFEPLYSYIGKPDIYGHALKITKINIVDALATAAVFQMGEGDEQSPLCLITDIPHINFCSHTPSEEDKNSIFIRVEEDLYSPLLKNAQWEKNN